MDGDLVMARERTGEVSVYTAQTLPVCLSRVRSDVKFECYFYSNLQSQCCCCYGSDSKVTKLVDWLFVTEFLQLMIASSWNEFLLEKWVLLPVRFPNFLSIADGAKVFLRFRPGRGVKLYTLLWRTYSIGAHRTIPTRIV